MLDSLKFQIPKSIYTYFHKILEKVSLQKIYAIALTTPADFSSIRLCIGTIDDLYNFAKDEQFNNITEFSGLVWNPDEWNLSSDDVIDSEIEKINNMIGDNFPFNSQNS